MTVLPRMQYDNLVAWLETEALALGTDNQRERYAAGVLPDDELLQLARAVVFKGFDFPRWHAREGRDGMARSFRHARTCTKVDSLAKRALQSKVWVADHFEVTDVGDMSAREWEVSRKIIDMVTALNMHPWMLNQGMVAWVDTCAHWLTCPDCKAEQRRAVAKVSVPWAGRTLVREFLL